MSGALINAVKVGVPWADLDRFMSTQALSGDQRPSFSGVSCKSRKWLLLDQLRRDDRSPDIR